MTTVKRNSVYGSPFVAAQAAANAAFAIANDYSSIEAAINSIKASLLWGGGTIFRDQIDSELRWIKTQDSPNTARTLSRKPIWMERDWGGAAGNLNVLLEIDPNYVAWLVWYERRIRGERAAFDIPGDKRRIEDKKILRRLAEATDENFWGKGHEYVNATLKGWLDDARARLVPPPIPIYASGWSALTEHSEAELGPPQEPGALAYGVNAQGKLDRLPVSDQVHLRDVPDQRRAYQDLREAAAALLEEGQRLGHRLKRALERFLQSLPERFEDAEAYLVWRDANALRRLHRAHREAAKSPEPDEAKLEPVVAEGLGGVLDLYNHFAFADDGLRAKDEARISPQERASAKAEAKVATPVVNAILATPDIATPEALDDIMADAESAELPADDPYADQVLAQANRTRRNWIAGLLEGGKQALANPKLLGKRTAIGVAIGVGTKVGEAVATAVFDMNSAHVLNFIATNATLLQGYVAVAFSSYPHLPELIGRIDLFWQRYGRK
jgi:hypothetical protein